MIQNKSGILPLGICFLVLVLASGALPASSAADVYEWVDANGVVHLSDHPPDIPEAFRKDTRVIKSDARREEISIPFERTPSGLIVVSVVLNDHIGTKMIFDTGADAVVLTQGLAARLDQDTSGTGEEITLHTNCGSVSGRVFRIKKIALGPASKREVRSLVAPIATSTLGGYEGLLGLSFLGDFKMTVDYKKGRILIGRE
ncbi:MAG: DUF4124 domain-containing protein [Deltaproteobacteria bacterium]|nr:DUF4124 domain-containing protein [Deltaproteobacteria bacterium]